MTNQTPEPGGSELERATARIDRFPAKPEVASDVPEGRWARAEMNRAYAMNLAMIRKAIDLAQAELAERPGTARLVGVCEGEEYENLGENRDAVAQRPWRGLV
jgi:hypothetical protein